nr:immunoglobulin light chain junction region [Macaca mulatta]
AYYCKKWHDSFHVDIF